VNFVEFDRKFWPHFLSVFLVRPFYYRDFRPSVIFWRLLGIASLLARFSLGLCKLLLWEYFLNICNILVHLDGHILCYNRNRSDFWTWNWRRF
jgi:hypothetical protein